MGGPIWSAPLHDHEWVASILENVEGMKERYPAYKKISAVLRTILEANFSQGEVSLSKALAKRLARFPANPGEEIIYDYHFNSKDEVQKILCYCNSKTCRQYLN